MFCNLFFAKSIGTNGLVINGTVYKTNLSGIEAVQRRIVRATTFKNVVESFEEAFADNKTLTVFELFRLGLVRELPPQPRFESPRILIQPNQENDSIFPTRCLKKLVCPKL